MLISEVLGDNKLSEVLGDNKLSPFYIHVLAGVGGARFALGAFQGGWSGLTAWEDRRWWALLLGQCVLCRGGWQKRAHVYIVRVVSTASRLALGIFQRRWQHEGCRIPDGFREGGILGRMSPNKILFFTIFSFSEFRELRRHRTNEARRNYFFFISICFFLSQSFESCVATGRVKPGGIYHPHGSVPLYSVTCFTLSIRQHT
jgi:hypothetical protein